MKVYYKTVVIPAHISQFGGEYPERMEYRELDVIFCCNKMKEVYDDYIEFLYDGTVDIEKRVYEDSEHTPIQFCPFCAQPIECIEKERVKQITKKKTETKEVTTEYMEEIPT